jgi:hypothetical protein
MAVRFCGGMPEQFNVKILVIVNASASMQACGAEYRGDFTAAGSEGAVACTQRRCGAGAMRSCFSSRWFAGIRRQACL